MELYTVQYSFEKIEKHKDNLLTRVSKSAYDLTLFKAKRKLKPVEFSLIDEKYVQVAKIANEFDPDDFPFIALKAKYSIWTNDKRLIEFSLKTKK